jgi:hypothetical protein
MFCVLELFKATQTTDKTVNVEGYNESYLKASFRKFYGGYNDLVCDYNSSLAHMLNDLFPTLCFTVVSILDLTTANPYTQFRLRANDGCNRSAEDAYSSATPDPTFTFVRGPYFPRSILYLSFGL